MRKLRTEAECLAGNQIVCKGGGMAMVGQGDIRSQRELVVFISHCLKRLDARCGLRDRLLTFLFG